MKYLVIVFALFLTACAGHGSFVQNESPAYWMKQYPGASQAKINTCMEKANYAYDQAVGTNWGPTLMKGNAWEACMDGK
jgi:hypothetical protein